MQDLEQKLKRLFQTALKLQPGPVRNQIFRELEIGTSAVAQVLIETLSSRLLAVSA